MMSAHDQHMMMLTRQLPDSQARYLFVLGIKRRRDVLDLSIERAAERAQISVEQWQRVELGQMFEDLVVMRAVLAALEVNSLFSLIGR
jgi:predicted transcriptional regulator